MNPAACILSDVAQSLNALKEGNMNDATAAAPAASTPPLAAIPKGFRHGVIAPTRDMLAALAILADGSTAVVQFGSVDTGIPGVLFSKAFHVAGKPVAVKCWRQIPRNWR